MVLQDLLQKKLKYNATGHMSRNIGFLLVHIGNIMVRGGTRDFASIFNTRRLYKGHEVQFQ